MLLRSERARDFQPQIIGLQIGAGNLIQLCEEIGNHAPRFVVDKAGIGQLPSAALCRMIDEGAGARIVPRLLRRDRRRKKNRGERKMTSAGSHGRKLVAG